MRIDIITLIPDLFEKVFSQSILGSAVNSGLVNVVLHQLRDWGEGRHRIVDDRPFGGGPGMVFRPEPTIRCINDVKKKSTPAPVIGLTPQGVPFNQQLAKDLCLHERIILVCGRYEGFDERICEKFDLELSVGDYVLTGGEIAAMVVTDSLSRMIPGTVGKTESVEQDSFYDGFLDHSQFTRPSSWHDKGVPDVLLEGNHSLIDKFRRQQSIFKTSVSRPDLFKVANMCDKDKELLQELLRL